MRTLIVQGEIVRIGEVRAVNNSWTVLRQEIIIRQLDNTWITVTLEDHKRGHYMVRTFQRIGLKLGMKIKAECELTGSDYQGKITNRVIVKHIN